jgi:hypothetical protein
MPGISALQLQRQLGQKRYETAWMLLHKLRRAMVAPERSPLTGEIEVDDAYVGGTDSGRRGGRDAFGAATIVIVAVEVRGSGSGRIRMEAVDDLSAGALCGFVQDNVLEGATVRTDAWQGFKRTIRCRSTSTSSSSGSTADARPWLPSKPSSASAAVEAQLPMKRSETQVSPCGASGIGRSRSYQQHHRRIYEGDAQGQSDHGRNRRELFGASGPSYGGNA